MDQNMACIPVVATTTAYSVGCIQITVASRVASRDDVMMSNVALQVCLSSCRQQVKKG